MKTMMRTMAAALLMFVAVSATAQSVTYPRFHFGIRGGLTVNSISIADFEGNDKALTFAHGGLAFDFRLAPFPLYLETGAYYMNKGFSTETTYYGLWGYGTDTEKVNDHYVYAPVLFSYHIYLNDKMSLQPFVGGTFGYLTESDDFESAIRVGLGFNLGRLYANVGYDFGVVKHDIIGYIGGSYSSVSTYRNNTFFATIGFNFAGTR